jgi:hypothetical protein
MNGKNLEVPLGRLLSYVYISGSRLCEIMCIMSYDTVAWGVRRHVLRHSRVTVITKPKGSDQVQVLRTRFSPAT